MKCKTNCTHVVLTIDDYFNECAVACKKGYDMDKCTRNINKDKEEGKHYEIQSNQNL